MMRFACYFAIAVCAFAGGAKASTITIDQGPPFIASYDNGGMGNGRGVSFLANQNFSITSMGVDLSVPASNSTNYVYQIYASTNGHDVGSLLSSVTFQLGAGNGYRDQAFNFNFSTGSYYVVNFARQDGQYLGNLGTHYVWEGASSAINYAFRCHYDRRPRTLHLGDDASRLRCRWLRCLPSQAERCAASSGLMR
jgi:hypothetical protein